jgi:Protein of unknown function (DUF4035)
LKVGRVDVEAMLRSMTARQLEAWRYYETIEPFEEYRGDWRNAHLVATLANIYRPKGGRVHKISEHLLPFDQKEKKQSTWQSMKATAASIYKMFGGAKPGEDRRRA